MTDWERDEIKRKIASLPSGGVSYKTISGKKYAYHQTIRYFLMST